MTGIGTAIVEAWQQSLKDLDMGPDGLFRVELHCLKCGKLLNADGNHPAEVHAGSSNGLCYGCTAAGPYLEKVAVLDGARRMNYPPHCPSWRRDREHFTGYPDCEICKGSGVKGWAPAVGNSSYRHYCEACAQRYDSLPCRAQAWAWSRLLMDRARAAFERRLKQHLGLRPRCSKKAYEAALATLDEGEKKAIAADILSRYRRLKALHDRRVERSQAFAWRQPTAEEAQAA